MVEEIYYVLLREERGGVRHPELVTLHDFYWTIIMENKAS